MPESILPQVKNIVFLMLENRSLDNLLGWLYKDAVPGYFYPSNSPKQYDGLVDGKYSNPDSDGTAVNVIPISDDIWQNGQGYAVPYLDPYEALRAWPVDIRAKDHSWKGVMNQFFGGQKVIPGLPSSNGGPPAMQGFLQDYYYWTDFTWKGHDILWTYTPAQARVINALAAQYAVSDRWFCSVPSDTSPNRAYSICGTSLGRESNLSLAGPEPPFSGVKTIFNWLLEGGKSWGLYFTDVYHKGKSYTEHLFPQMSPGGEIGDITIFKSRAADGSLPAFSYLEPKWTDVFPLKEGTDYHPPAHICQGESFLHDVYQALTGGPQWKKNETLFIITFDEHGGTYDHVSPPWGAVNPDGKDGRENGFKFDLFGARVPTILVSPYVRPATVFRAPEGSKYDFDHASFVATLLKWAGVSLNEAKQSQRVLSAPTFEGVFADQVVNGGTVAPQPCTSSPSPIPAEAARLQAHPAGSAEELRALLEGIPVVSTRVILLRNETLEGVRTDVARYRQDPEKFETELEKPQPS